MKLLPRTYLISSTMFSRSIRMYRILLIMTCVHKSNCLNKCKSHIYPFYDQEVGLLKCYNAYYVFVSTFYFDGHDFVSFILKLFYIISS